MALTGKQREQTADQILVIVEELFVHHRMKTALYGVDARSLLRGLRTRAAGMTDLEFHRAMRSVVIRIRDRHTRYRFAGAGSDYGLPFDVERAFDGDKPVYLVSRSRDRNVPVGSAVVHWNGVPTEFVLAELAEDIGAGNDATRHALARVYLTQRPAARFDPPHEDEVRLDLLLPDGTPREIRSTWSASANPVAVTPGLRSAGSPVGQGVDLELLVARRRLFETFSPTFEVSATRTYDNVKVTTIAHAGAEFGHLRIFDFGVDDADDFAYHVAELVKRLPRHGVVIDLRGNPGGYIKAGELLLQMFTSVRIQPHAFRFRASDAVNYMIGSSGSYGAWMPTVAQGARLGAEHSAGFPIEDDEDAFNRIGRIYPGPSVLVVDALTFSTGDMFTAGYKDHGIGAVICTDENISAGGANNWQYDVLRASFPGFLLPATTKGDLDQGKITSQVREIFASNGRSLPQDVRVQALPPDRLGAVWRISTGIADFLVGQRSWLRQELGVYCENDNRFVGELPPGVDFGFSIRQAVRRRLSDGLVLEDDGIAADHYYRMSRRDVLSGNGELLSFACGLLAASS